MKARRLSTNSTLAEINYRHPALISATRQRLAGGIPLDTATASPRHHRTTYFRQP
jgi:hypothetical protein